MVINHTDIQEWNREFVSKAINELNFMELLEMIEEIHNAVNELKGDFRRIEAKVNLLLSKGV